MEELKTAEEIHQYLLALKNSNTQLSLRFQHDNLLIPMRVVGSDPKRHQLFISPAKQMVDMPHTTSELQWFAFYQGIRIESPLYLGTLTKQLHHHSLKPSKNSIFTLNYPRSLTYHQRRQSYRVPLNQHLTAILKLQQINQNGNATLDISSTGLKSIWKAKPELPSKREWSANISFEGELDINCQVQLRHCKKTESGDYEVGFKISSIAKNTQRELERFLLFLQRRMQQTQLLVSSK